MQAEEGETEGKTMNFEQFKKAVLDGEAETTMREPALRVEPSDDELYSEYRDLLSGEAARRRSIEDAREDQREREQELRSWAAYSGSPLPRDLEDI